MGEEDPDQREPDEPGPGGFLGADPSFSGEGTVTIFWDAISLTIAVALIGVFATLSGVFIAPWDWGWRLGYVAFWIAVTVSVFWVRRIRDRIIYFIRRRIPRLPPPDARRGDSDAPP